MIPYGVLLLLLLLGSWAGTQLCFDANFMFRTPDMSMEVLVQNEMIILSMRRSAVLLFLTGSEHYFAHEAGESPSSIAKHTKTHHG